MTVAKHTPEPWAICPLEGHIVRPWSHDYRPGDEFKLMGDYRGGYVVDAIAERERRNESARSQQPADFARIVACVNYCADVPGERLSEDSLAIKLEHIERLTAERDLLLKALRDVEKHHVTINGYARRPETRSTTLRIVRAALAKVEPESIDEPGAMDYDDHIAQLDKGRDFTGAYEP